MFFEKVFYFLFKIKKCHDSSLGAGLSKSWGCSTFHHSGQVFTVLGGGLSLTVWLSAGMVDQ